nr:helix-turn-helix transcriptional regulator [Mucilaginibacter sp. L294]
MHEESSIARFGLIIEAKRRECGYTQQYLAHLVDESVVFVRLLEKGRLDPTLSDMAKLANEFNLSVFDLLNELS